jgi:hypothetical protein
MILARSASVAAEGKAVRFSTAPHFIEASRLSPNKRFEATFPPRACVAAERVCNARARRERAST